VKQRDIANFETNLQQFYETHGYEPIPILEAYLLSIYPRDILHPISQGNFDKAAVYAFENIDKLTQTRMQRSLRIATDILANMVLPYAKKKNNI
jgi:hypothetical protein